MVLLRAAQGYGMAIRIMTFGKDQCPFPEVADRKAVTK